MKRNKTIKSYTKPKRNKTGEKTFLEFILKKREPVSFVSGRTIEGDLSNCAHVLPKGKYPEWKFSYENVVLLTWKEHQLFDHGTEEQREKYANEMKTHGVEVDWQSLFDLREKLLNSKLNQNQSI